MRITMPMVLQSHEVNDMAIKTEIFQSGEKQFTKTYSDANRYVVREEIEYSEAIDPSEFNRIYTEGRLMDDIEYDASEILNIITGEQE